MWLWLAGHIGWNKSKKGSRMTEMLKEKSTYQKAIPEKVVKKINTEPFQWRK